MTKITGRYYSDDNFTYVVTGTAPNRVLYTINTEGAWGSRNEGETSYGQRVNFDREEEYCTKTGTFNLD